ncbi:MAG: HAD family hydrolase [Marinifilaceae bacterium]
MKNIIFDLGGVVVDWSPEKVLNGYPGDKQFIIDLFEGGFFNNYWVEFDRGTLTQEQVQFEMSRFSGRPYEECQDLVDYIKYSLTDIPETVDLIKSLSNEGYNLYCLSNMSNEFYDYLKERDVFTYFKGQIISAHEKLVKPEPEIYQLILDRFDLRADESLFIDDLQANVDAAQELGIHTVRFAPRDKGYRDIATKLGRA